MGVETTLHSWSWDDQKLTPPLPTLAGEDSSVGVGSTGLVQELALASSGACYACESTAGPTGPTGDLLPWGCPWATSRVMCLAPHRLLGRLENNSGCLLTSHPVTPPTGAESGTLTRLEATCDLSEDSPKPHGWADAPLLATTTSPTQLELSEKGDASADGPIIRSYHTPSTPGAPPLALTRYAPLPPLPCQSAAMGTPVVAVLGSARSRRRPSLPLLSGPSRPSPRFGVCSRASTLPQGGCFAASSQGRGPSEWSWTAV